MLKIKDHKKIIFQTLRIDNHILAKFLPYPKISKASLQLRCQALKLYFKQQNLAE